MSAKGNGSIEESGRSDTTAWELCSGPGKLREANEDFAAVHSPASATEPPFFVVCDGLGGQAAGEVASRVATEAAVAAWASGPRNGSPPSLRAAVRAANVAVFDVGLDPAHRGLATTLTALCPAGREAVIAHVGDSRCYLVRNGQWRQLTADHSRVAEMLRMGLLSPEQAARHPGRSQLTRTIGSEPLVAVDVVRTGTEEGDSFVLCSDGIWDVVAGHEIAAVVSGSVADEAHPAGGAARRLTDLAIERGTPDNVTALVVRVTATGADRSTGGRRLLLRRVRR